MAIAKVLDQSRTIAQELESSGTQIEIPDPMAPVLGEGGTTVTPTEDGGVVVDFNPTAKDPIDAKSLGHNTNLANIIPQGELDKLGIELTAQYVADRTSRGDWEKQYIEGIKLLGFKIEERTEPWDGACGVHHPMLAESVIRFQAQTIQEIYPANGPVKTKIAGKTNREIKEQSKRVEGYLNYLTTEDMAEYRDELEKLLFSLPIAGSAFKKVYYDESLGRPCALFVPAEDFVVSYGAVSLATCGRATHVMRTEFNEIRKLQTSGFYRDIDLKQTVPNASDIEKEIQKLTGASEAYSYDNRHELLEMIVDLNLESFPDPDGIARPYVVTIDRNSEKVLSVYRNWFESDPKQKRRNHFVHYQYMPGFGFYGFGLVHTIGGLAKSSTSLLRMLIDAGVLSNLPSGLKARGMNIDGDNKPQGPGEWRDVDIPGGTIKDNLAFLPYKEPSAVLYQLLKDLVEDGRRFASAADVKAADINGQAPVGTTLAVLEREMKVISAIQARVHSSMKHELKILSRIIHDYGPGEYPYLVEGQELLSEDFDDRVDIIPVSDPNAGTMAQRIMQYQAALQLSAQAPQDYDLPALHRKMLGALGIDDIEDILPNKDDLKPLDPITEDMEIIKGGRVRAFAYQDHEAHIQAHMAAMQNPKIIELIGQAPDAQVKLAIMQAHIAEHVAFAYRDRIEKEMGVTMPDPSEPLPEDIEYRLSRLVAPAAAQLSGKEQREAQAKEQLEQAEDPIVKQKNRELDQAESKEENRHTEVMEKIKLDLKKHEDLLISKDEDRTARTEIAGAEIGADIAHNLMRSQTENRKISSVEQVQGAKIGANIASDLLKDDKPSKK